MGSKENNLVLAEIDGKQVLAPHYMSVIQAFWHSGYERIKGIGCLGGVCGSCRILVKRKNESRISMELACETQIEEGLQVMFVESPVKTILENRGSETSERDTGITDLLSVYPETADCRNCGGCTEVCPKGINVESGVNLAGAGKYEQASDIFERCVMCDFCSITCPEHILPNYVGLLARAIAVRNGPLPRNLEKRLQELADGKHKF